jgi:transketolase
MRALEQIKVDIAFNNLNVKLLGAGGGLVYGAEGVTHHSIEDIAIMRSIPNMTIVCPGDAREAESLAKESVSYKGPLYIRFGRDFDPFVHKGKIDFKIGKGIVVNQGKDICLMATGTMLQCASRVSERLREKGFDPTLVSMHTVKPIDAALIKECMANHSSIFTLEEHNILGGLGGAVAEILAEEGYAGKFKRIGIGDKYYSDVGGADYLIEKAGLDEKSVTEKILKTLGK